VHDSSELDDLIASVRREVTAGLTTVEWAEDEIERAVKEHPEAENDLYHAFRLLVPTISSPAWGTEFVYRGHARELLERVARGEDTRPGTAAECSIAMAEVSKQIPLHGAASGFYFRMWGQAFPDHKIWAEGEEHHEALYGSEIDDHERNARRKLSQPTRRITALPVECDGWHHGEQVACKYDTGAEEAVAS